MPNNHLQYAITWFSLALAALMIYFLSQHRRASVVLRRVSSIKTEPCNTWRRGDDGRGQFAILGDRGVLAMSGPDRRVFLQGLVSNDVEKLAGDRALYAALLTAQGKYLHDFVMVEVGDAIWLDAEAARLADLKRRLSMYRLRAKVEIADLPELGGGRHLRRRRACGARAAGRARSGKAV